ncbi:hypothetical protein Dimus_017174 [Dionaea muscipula]
MRLRVWAPAFGCLRLSSAISFKKIVDSPATLMLPEQTYLEANHFPEDNIPLSEWRLRFSCQSENNETSRMKQYLSMERVKWRNGINEVPYLVTKIVGFFTYFLSRCSR